jgi:hypothetical protein
MIPSFYVMPQLEFANQHFLFNVTIKIFKSIILVTISLLLLAAKSLFHWQTMLCPVQLICKPIRERFTYVD